MGESQKTWALVLSQKMPSLSLFWVFLRMPSLSLFWVFLRSNCVDPIVGDMLGFRMADNDSNEADGTPQPPQWCYPPQQETRGYSKAVTLSLSRKAVQGKVGFVMRPAPQ